MQDFCRFDYVIIDEISALLKYMTTEHINTSKGTNITYIFQQLQLLLKNTKKLLCLDADISINTIKLINDMTEN